MLTDCKTPAPTPAIKQIDIFVSCFGKHDRQLAANPIKCESQKSFNTGGKWPFLVQQL